MAQPGRSHCEPGIAVAFLRGMLWVAWQAIRWPVLALLLMVEPFIGFVLASAALLAIPTAFLFEFAGTRSEFPFWGMIAFGVACFLTLAGYHALLRLLAR